MLAGPLQRLAGRRGGAGSMPGRVSRRELAERAGPEPARADRALWLGRGGAGPEQQPVRADCAVWRAAGRLSAVARIIIFYFFSGRSTYYFSSRPSILETDYVGFTLSYLVFTGTKVLCKMYLCLNSRWSCGSCVTYWRSRANQSEKQKKQKHKNSGTNVLTNLRNKSIKH